MSHRNISRDVMSHHITFSHASTSYHAKMTYTYGISARRWMTTTLEQTFTNGAWIVVNPGLLFHIAHFDPWFKAHHAGFSGDNPGSSGQSLLASMSDEQTPFAIRCSLSMLGYDSPAFPFFLYISALSMYMTWSWWFLKIEGPPKSSNMNLLK